MTDPTPDVDAAIGGPILYGCFVAAYVATNDINAAQSVLRKSLDDARDEWTVDELFALLVDNMAERARLDRQLSRVSSEIDWYAKVSPAADGARVARHLQAVLRKDV